jgi:hypothetical protein
MSTEATKKPDNYFWILSENKFMYVPTRALCARDAVQRQLGKEETVIAERDRVCSNLTWIPGADTIIADKAITDGELDDHPGNNLFNLYKKPRPLRDDADPAKAKFWLDLGEKLFGDDLPRILDCLAFKAQYPAIKINHGLVLGSYDQGIGKDAFVSPIKRAVGSANWRSKGASAIIKNIENNFTPFLRSTILQISEVHEMGDKRFGFYDSIKDWCAAPPDMLTIADKNVKEYPILNAVFPILTTNHLTDGLYIPEQDRRIDYVWSPRRQSDFTDAFWRDYWDRVTKRGDAEHIAAFLMARDVTKFNPGEPPPKTDAWHQAVNANRKPEDSDLSDVLDAMADDWAFETGELGCPRPFALTLDQIRRHPRATHALRLLFGDRGKARTAIHRLATARYGSFNNPDRADGQWKINGRAQTIYTWSELTPGEKMNAVAELIRIETLPDKVAADAELVEDFE